jgi:DNA-binding transcriptional LysR family regulator
MNSASIVAPARGTGDDDESGSDLAIGVFASICRDRLGERLLAFARTAPSVGIGVHEMSRTALLPALVAGELALVMGPGRARFDLPSMQLWNDQVMIATGPEHRFAKQKLVTPAQLRDEIFIVSRQQHGGDMHRFLSQRINPNAPALNAMLMDLGPPRVMDQVAEGEGIALICASHVEHRLDERIVVRPIDAVDAEFPVSAYWRDSKPEPQLAALIDMLAAGARG